MKIASLSTYPVSSPFHGGQRRVNAIIAALRAAQHEVQHFPLYFGDDFPEASAEEQEFALAGAIRNKLAASGKREDIHLADILDAQDPTAQRMLQKLAVFQPDIIQFEQPWLYAVLKDAITQDPQLCKAALVYSSQNVEADLLPEAFKTEALDLERDLIAAADLVISVSTSDAKRFKGLGAKQTVVAPNGSHLPVTLGPDIVSPITQDYALFVGSAHRPNSEGYWDNFGMIPGFIPPSARLVVVGGVCNLLGSDARFQKFRSLNNEVVHNMGVVPEDMLNRLLGFASVICLPISSGGGTNLKTAEALLSGKPIIAMSAAFRGFEHFIHAPGVFIADNPKGFKSLIQRFFQKKLDLGPPRDPDPSLTWAGTLHPLIQHYGAGRP